MSADTSRTSAACGDVGRDLVAGRVAIALWVVPTALVVLAPLLPLPRAWLWVPAFAIMGVSCLVNARRCGRRHCFVTGPLFLVAALIEIATAATGVQVPALLLGGAVLVVAVGSAIEERVSGRYRACS